MIILDTNVCSVLMSGSSQRLEPWLSTVAETDLYVMTITRAEIRYGLARLPVGARRTRLSDRADMLFTDVADRMLSFESRAADAYGDLVASRERIGRPISVPDAQIAAIARVHRSSVATRNVKDFMECGIAVTNPFWSGDTAAH